MGPTTARHISHFYEIISAFVYSRRVSGQTEPFWMLLFVLSFHFIISLQPSLNPSEFGFLFRFNILSLFRFSLMKSAKWIFLSELISLSDFFQLRLWLIPSLMLIVSMQTIFYELWVTTMQINSKIGNEKESSHCTNIRSGVWDFDHQSACCARTRVLADRAEDISIWFLEMWKREWKICCLNSAHQRIFRFLIQNYSNEDVPLIIIADFCVILCRASFNL